MPAILGGGEAVRGAAHRFMSISASGGHVMAGRAAAGAAFPVIVALSFSHLLNDMMQSLVPALYPMLKGSYGLSFAQIGMIALTMQAAGSPTPPASISSTRFAPFCRRSAC
jgi:hypothetical protein